MQSNHLYSDSINLNVNLIQKHLHKNAPEEMTDEISENYGLVKLKHQINHYSPFPSDFFCISSSTTCIPKLISIGYCMQYYHHYHPLLYYHFLGTHTYTHTYMYIHIHICTYICTHIHIYIHTYTHIHIYKRERKSL